VHPRPDILQREQRSLRGQTSGERENRWNHKTGHIIIVAEYVDLDAQSEQAAMSNQRSAISLHLRRL